MVRKWRRVENCILEGWLGLRYWYECCVGMDWRREMGDLKEALYILKEEEVS